MIFEKLNNFENMSSTEKQIAKFIFENRYDLEKLNVTLISNATFTSTATIIRLCKKLGFKGFKDFKINFIKELTNDDNINKNVNPDIPFNEKDNLSIISKNILELITNNLNKTFNNLQFQRLASAIKIIENSKRLFIFAKGDSYIRALTFYNRMIKINKYVILADEHHESSYNVRNIQENDCALFITYSAQHYDYNQYIKVLNAFKIPTIIITSNRTSELASKCNEIIYIPKDESYDSKIACFASQISFEYILDILYSNIFKNNFQLNYEQKEIKEKYVSRLLTGKTYD